MKIKKNQSISLTSVVSLFKHQFINYQTAITLINTQTLYHNARFSENCFLEYNNHIDRELQIQMDQYTAWINTINQDDLQLAYDYLNKNKLIRPINPLQTTRLFKHYQFVYDIDFMFSFLAYHNIFLDHKAYYRHYKNLVQFVTYALCYVNNNNKPFIDLAQGICSLSYITAEQHKFLSLFNLMEPLDEKEACKEKQLFTNKIDRLVKLSQEPIEYKWS